MAAFAQRAARRLRKEGQVTVAISVFATTSPHRPGPAHSAAVQVRLPAPTNEPAPLAAAARSALVPRLQHGYSYMRAGLMCLDLTGAATVALLPGVVPEPAPLGVLIDAVNRRFGAGTLAHGRVGAHSPAPWENRQANLSPRYTTAWDELRTVS